MENTNNIPHNVVGRFTHLTDYYYLLRKRLWLIVSILFVAVLSTVLITFSMRPVYRATAKLIIGKDSRRSPLSGRLLEYDSYISQHLTFQTHYKLATSRPVLEQVLAQIDLAGEPLKQLSLSRFFSTVKSNATRLITGIFSSSPTENLAQSEERIDAEKIWRLRSKISVQEIKDTRLLNILVEDHSPRAARDIANAIAENYIKYDSSTRLESSRKMLEWLNKQLYNMRKNVEEAEKTFLAYKEKANLFSIEGKQKINVQKIEDMNTSYIEVKSKRMVLEAKINELKKLISNDESGTIRNIPPFIKNEIVNSLYVELLATEIEYKGISGVFKHKHPEMIKVVSKLTELRQKIREHVQEALDNARSERTMLIAREKALQDAMRSYEREAIDANRGELQYAILEREVEANREIYNVLLAKIKEADITDEITKTNLRLVEPANLPVTPVRPKKARNIMMSVIFGLCAGAGLSLFLEHLDQTIHNAEELERYIGLPLLAEIPKTTGNTLESKQADEPASLTVLTQPLNSRFCEAFRTLATNLRFTDLNRGGVFLVTSGAPKEGKSTTSLNLGITMAQLGRKTLLIDADLRLPVSKKIVGDAIDGGLTDILVETFNTPVNKGTLGELGSGDIHKLLEIQEKSGVLRYENQNEVFTVSFHKGQIINVDWPSRPATARLGSLLVRCDKITKDQAQIALAKRETTSQRLGQVLLHLGFLTPEELAGPLRIHLSENIRALSRCQSAACRNASFTFEEDHSPASLTLDEKEAALQQSMGHLNGVSAFPTPFLHNQIKNRLYRVDGSDLWVLPSVDLIPNPTELLAGNRMRILLELLREQFDLIFIDTPPVAALSDAAVLASLVDGVIMVIKAGDTDLRLARRALEQLDAVQAKVTGIVLNMLDEKKDPYYYGRYVSKYDDYYGRHDQEAGSGQG